MALKVRFVELPALNFDKEVAGESVAEQNVRTSTIDNDLSAK
jgi:hypothetical protein